MELLSIAVVAGTAGVSAFASSRALQIVQVIEEKLKWSPEPGERLVVDDKLHQRSTGQAELSLD